MAKKKRTLSEEQKAKMKAGRDAAKARKLAEESKTPEAPALEPDTVTTPVDNTNPQNDAAVSGADSSSELDEVPAEVLAARQKAIDEAKAAEPSIEQAQPEQATPTSESLMLELMMTMKREMEETSRVNREVIAALRSGDDTTKSQALNTIGSMQGATISAQGVQGVVFRYPVESSHYPDPSDRLYDDPQLRRFAMRENFYFKWEVTGETYEKNGVTYTEPRFMVELWRLMFDPETGEPTGKMFLISRQIQHEDEFIARLSADKLGIKFDTVPELLDEMRYQRIKQWLHGVFKPNRINTHRNKVNQMVIGGKVVEVKDTEELTTKGTADEQSETLSREIALTPAETREAIRAGLI